MLLLKNRKLAAPLATAIALCLAAAAPAVAKTVYSWVTESGAQAYTDDAKRIPAAYRKTAVKRDFGPLSKYDRYTPVVSDRERLAKRLEELRDDEPTYGMPPYLGGPHEKMLNLRMGGRYGGRGGLVLPLQGDSDEPITVENLRTKPRDGMATRHVTVVRQGDKVIGLIKNERTHSPGPDGFVPEDVSEEDLIDSY